HSLIALTPSGSDRPVSSNSRNRRMRSLIRLIPEPPDAARACRAVGRQGDFFLLFCYWLSNQAWNISTFHKLFCQLCLPAVCSAHFCRTWPTSKKPSLRRRASSRRPSAQSRSGPRNQDSMGTEKPTFGRSTNLGGTYRYKTCRSSHFLCPFRTFM